MYLCIESVYDGTWGSGPVPEEIVLADLLLETGWTWREWSDTPRWIQQTVADTIRARRERDQREAEGQERGRAH